MSMGISGDMKIGINRVGGGVAATVANQSADMGTTQPVGTGGWRPVDATGFRVALSSYDSLISGSLGSHTPVIVSGRLEFTGADGAPDAAVLQCTTTTGKQFNATINSEASVWYWVPDATASGELGEIITAVIAKAGGYWDGYSVKARAGGDQLWAGEFTEVSGRTNYALTSTMTVTYEDTTSRPRMVIGTGSDANTKTLLDIQFLHFEGVDWLAQFEPGTLNGDGTRTGSDPDNAGGLYFRGTIGDVTFNDCIFDGGLSAIYAEHGAAFDSKWGGHLMRANSGPVCAGTFTVTNCTFKDASRGLSLWDCTTGKMVFEHNTFTQFTQDFARFDGAHPNGSKFNFNKMHTPRNITPPEVSVISIDTGTDQMTLNSDKFGAATDTFLLNLSESTTTIPAGLNYPGVGGANDYTATIVSVGSGETIISLVENITSSGSNVYVRVEPAHADFLQAYQVGKVVDDWEIIGNDIFSEANQDGVWMQMIFLEDIAGSGADNWRNDPIVALNRMYGGVAQGIWLYASIRGILSDNLTVEDASATSSPTTSIKTHFTAAPSLSLFHNNIGQSFDNSGTGTGTNKTVASGGESASGYFSGGTGDYTPTTFDEFVSRYIRNDLDGVVDYDAGTYDMPSINTCTMPAFTDDTGAVVSTLTTQGPVQITSPLNSAGGASSYGVLASVQGGSGAPELRITSDVGGSTVITDWQTAPAVIEANEYLWVRDTSSSSASTQTDVFVRAGRSYDTWSITTAAAFIYSEDFSTDNTGDFEATSTGTIAYDSGGTALRFSPSATSFEGVCNSAAITVVSGQDYLCTLNIRNDDILGEAAPSLDVVYGTTVGGFELLAGADRIFQDITMEVTDTITASGTSLYITVRRRGTTAMDPGYFSILDILVEDA